VEAETFRLRYADAEQIKENIEELFGEASAAQRGGQGRNQQQGGFRFPGQQQQEAATSATTEIRVSANTQQNSVTVVADPAVLEQVRQQIEAFWDLPLPDEAVVPRIYDLKNSDPVKVRDLLEGLFGRGTPSGTTAAGQGPGGGGQGGSTGTSQGVGRLAGQFSFEAIPEAGRLVVVAKSPDNLAVIDKIIEGLDQPQTIGLPAIVELKHASAEDLAEQLNALLSQDGTRAQIRRSASGLTESSSTASPFAEETGDAADAGAEETTSPDMISFWWQVSQPPTDSQGPSNLVGQIRIVPVWRQNALMVLAPLEYKNSIVALIEDLDRPGRQVLISAIVAEVSRDDATALGLRWSSGPIAPTNNDNSISIGSTSTATENNFLGSLFDTSVLNADVDLNLVLQALAQKTAVSILSEPKVFTSDNQEAEFFSGQDIPFITESQPNTQGNLVQSFD
jgi:general secretion pathway protein D